MYPDNLSDASAPEPHIITPEAIAAAVAQLRRSERGGAALAAFVKMIENGGGGLDADNWHALSTLCRASSTGNGYNIASWVNETKRARPTTVRKPRGRI